MPIIRWKSQAFDSEKVDRYKDLQKFIKFIKVPYDPKTKKCWKQGSQKSEIDGNSKYYKYCILLLILAPNSEAPQLLYTPIYL